MSAAEFLVPLFIGVAAGALLGYWLRGVEEMYVRARRAAGRFTRHDLKTIRAALRELLDEPRAHFRWLERATPEMIHESDAVDRKVRAITDWVSRKQLLFPRELRPHLALIQDAAYRLGHRDRSSLHVPGAEMVEAAWRALDDYEQRLTIRLRGAA